MSFIIVLYKQGEDGVTREEYAQSRSLTGAVKLMSESLIDNPGIRVVIE